MIKRYCDKCSKEIIGNYYSIKINKITPGFATIDFSDYDNTELCSECYMQIKSLIEFPGKSYYNTNAEIVGKKIG